ISRFELPLLGSTAQRSKRQRDRGATKKGRRRSPGGPSKLPLLGSNQDSPDPESGVLPVTPRGREQLHVPRRHVTRDSTSSSDTPGATSWNVASWRRATVQWSRSEEHTSELQSPCNLVCRLLLEKKNTHSNYTHHQPSDSRDLLKTTFRYNTQNGIHLG